MFDDRRNIKNNALNLPKTNLDGWVSSSDMLPDDAKLKLTFEPSNPMGRFQLRYLLLNQNAWFSLEGKVIELSKVTHWANLPEDPVVD